MVFCKHKLTVQEVAYLQNILNDVSCTCRTTFDDLDLPGCLTNVFVEDHSCAECIEELHYSCGFEPICVYCGSEEVKDSFHNAKNAAIWTQYVDQRRNLDLFLFSLTLCTFFKLCKFVNIKRGRETSLL